MASMILRTGAELFVVLAMIFGFVKENKFIQTERKALRFLRRLRRKARDARAQERERDAVAARFADEYETRRSSKTAVRRGGAGEKSRKSARNRVA